MKVSVIVPNYNHASYLEQRMESILSQTYQDFEIIILDDCSADDSQKIIEQYRSNPKVSTIDYNEKNSGSVFGQWTKGIRLAKGEFIWIAESDDWCENNLLEILVKGTEENPGCTLAFAQSYCVDENGIVLWYTHFNHLAACMDGKKYVSDYMLRRNAIVNASMAIFKKEYFDRVSNDFLSFRFSGDWLFWIEMAMLGDVFITGRYLNYFRYHSKNSTTKANRTGYGYAENIKVLSVLKSKNMISDFDFKQSFGRLYKRYKKEKNNYSVEEKKMIMQSFHEVFSKARFRKFMLAFNIYWVRKNFAKWRNSF
jgi:glycosyltransferase involved in cell wall biosynthesis